MHEHLAPIEFRVLQRVLDDRLAIKLEALLSGVAGAIAVPSVGH
jgi:hypothetical protein